MPRRATTHVALSTPPARTPRYHEGPSTPRPVRFNDALWADFCAAAQERGWTARDALRWLMEEYIAREAEDTARRTKGGGDG